MRRSKWQLAVALTVLPSCAADSDDLGTVTMPVTSAAAAGDDAYSVNEDHILNVAAAGVLGNDTNAVAAVLVAGPSHGLLAFQPDGSFSYTPDANFFGIDSFTYQALDASNALSNVATVTIDVTSVNDAPLATDDTYVATQNLPLVVPAPGMLANDSDVDDASSTLFVYSITGSVQGGSVTIQIPSLEFPYGAGDFVYTPPMGFVGTDSFTYQVGDPNGAVDTGTVVIHVGVAPPPEQQLDDLVSDIDILIGDATLDQGNGNALVSKLEAAKQQLERGNCQTAAMMLQAFIHQVGALIGSGGLSAQDGQPLIDAANAIVETLDC